jgi:hypothetical protein
MHGPQTTTPFYTKEPSKWKLVARPYLTEFAIRRNSIKSSNMSPGSHSFSCREPAISLNSCPPPILWLLCIKLSFSGIPLAACEIWSPLKIRLEALDWSHGLLETRVKFQTLSEDQPQRTRWEVQPSISLARREWKVLTIWRSYPLLPQLTITRYRAFMPAATPAAQPLKRQ